MRKRTVIILGAVGVLASAAVVLWFFWPRAGSERLLGSWEGTGTVPANMSLNFGENPGGKFDAAASLRTTIKATFNPDGTMTMSSQSTGEDIHISLVVPDPKKPDEVARWTAAQAEGGALVVRLIEPGHPEAPEWRVSFRGPDEFTMVPANPAKGTDTMVFRRVSR